MFSRLFGRSSSSVDASTAAALIADGKAMPLDVREKHEWDAGHISGARHIPLASLATRLQTKALPKDRTVICVCHSGMRSSRARSLLERNGYQALNLSGGMRHWQAAGLPVTTR
jgi:rhodanese-related sulfurtransferase